MGMPTVLAITRYWENRIPETDLGIDWGDDDCHQRCWRCGVAKIKRKRWIERCHITPKSLGGSDEVDNLILLCKACHKEAPDHVSDNPNHIWEWIAHEHSGFYGDMWTRRAYRIFKEKHGRDFMGGVDLSLIPENERANVCDLMIKEELEKTATHFGTDASDRVPTYVSILETIERRVMRNDIPELE